MYKKYVQFKFQNLSLLKLLHNQMAAVIVMLQVTPSFSSKTSKTVFLFLQSPLKTTMWLKNTVLPTTMTRCASFLILVVTFFQWETSKSCYKNWTHSASTTNTWILYIHFQSTIPVAKVLSRVENPLIMCSRPFIWNWKVQKCGRNSQHRQRKLIKNCTKKIVELFPEDKRLHRSKQVNQPSQTKLNKLKITFEINLIRVVGCFLDGQCKYTTGIVIAERIVLKTNNLMNPKDT